MAHYALTIYKANSEIWSWKQDERPSLEQMQEAVGGLIEQVPEDYYLGHRNKWFRNQHQPSWVDGVWCNEEGLFDPEPVINPFFPPAPWGDRLVGDVLVVELVGDNE